MKNRYQIVGILSLLSLAVVAGFLFSGSDSAAAGDESREHTLWASYWTVEPGFRSTLTMKNNRGEETLPVQVSLYFANGEEYYLDPMQLGPRQTAVIDLNQVYESLPSSIRARAGKEGTAEVTFEGPNESALMGSISVTNPQKGLAWNFRLYLTHTNLLAVPVRGLFWFPNRKADGFVAVQNASEGFITVTPRFHVGGEVHSLPPTALAPGQGYKLELRKELRRLGLNNVSAGGIEFTYEGVADALKAHGVLFDRQGFSAEIDFATVGVLPEEDTFTLRTPRFAIGPADPRLGLPARTVFEPSLALHNFGADELEVTLSVGYRTEEGAEEVPLTVSLAGAETKVVALEEKLEEIIPEGVSWASLEVSYRSRRNQLAAALVSTSREGEHSLVSVMNPVQGNTSEGWYWRADTDSTTLIGILNTDTQEATVAVWLDFNSNGVQTRYNLPEIIIPPRAAELVDVGALIAAGLPDEDGDLIPPEVTYGGYRVRKVGGRLDTTLITEALVINRRTKTYLTFYNTCCAITAVTLSPSPITGPVGVVFPLAVIGLDSCSGLSVTLTSSASYSSATPSIASVNSLGLVALLAPGSTSVTARVNSWIDSPFCLTFATAIGPDLLPPLPCGCFLTTANASSPVTVTSACGDVRDQIRQEYEVRLIPVPACGEFAQTKYSTHFSFAEMNGGDYTWAVITDRQLTRLEQTRVNVGNQPIDVISGYRNPVKNASVDGRLLSRHQYGDAADSCPRDYNGDGVVNSADQAILVTAAQEANVGFNEIVLEPLTCVHLGSL